MAKAQYRTCRTEREILDAYAEAERNLGRSVFADARHDAYMATLARRMADAAARLGETVDVRIK